MKKLCAIALLCLLLAGVCACGQAEPEEIAEQEITSQAATNTIAAPTTMPISFPASYKDAPKAYWPMLGEFCY